MSAITYKEKLKDPRWQKKRLKILERDHFSCHLCGDDQSTLHVHHKYYERGEPWDIDDLGLVTLCAECHEEETGSIKEELSNLKTSIAMAGGMSGEMNMLSIAFADTIMARKQLVDYEWVILFREIERLLKSRVDGSTHWENAKESYFAKINNRAEKKAKAKP